MGRIVLDHEELARVLKALRIQGKRIVFAAGTFDLWNPGMVRALLDAGTRGHFLVVAVHSEKDLRKNSRLHSVEGPFQNDRDRLEIVAAVHNVSYATLYEDATLPALLHKLRPTVICVGSGDSFNPIDRELCREIGADSLVLEDGSRRLSKRLIEKIRNVRVPRGQPGKAIAAKAGASRGTSKPHSRPVVARSTARKSGSRTISSRARGSRENEKEA